MSTASKLWMPGPQDRIFQHLLKPKAGPEGGRYQKLPIMFVRAGMLNKIPKIHVYSFKTLDARASGLHFREPEACPEGGIKNYPQFLSKS